MVSCANIDNQSLIRYVINGIPDFPRNKCLLYDCTNIHEFKQKLKMYQEIRRHAKKITLKYESFPKYDETTEC